MIERVLEEMPARPVTHFDDLFATDAEARERTEEPGSGVDASMSWVLVFLGFCAADHPPRGGPLRRGEDDRDAGRTLLPLLRPDDLVVQARRNRVRRSNAIPLGGYVKINGMNPEEEMPPGDEHRAYYKQPVWKRIVVIAAGPAVNIVLAFVILFVVFSFPAGATTKSARSRPAHRASAAAGAAARRPDRRRRRQELSRPRPAKTGSKSSAKRSRSHECAGEPTDGCAATTPAEVTVERDGQRHDRSRIYPALRRRRASGR